MKCPHCKSTNYKEIGKRPDARTFRYRCMDCKRRFSNKTAHYGDEDNDQLKRSNSVKYTENPNNAVIEGSYKSELVEKAKILDEFLSLHKVDLNKWEVDRFTIGSHDITMSHRDQDLEWDVEKDESGTSQQLMSGYSVREPGGVTKTNYNIKVYLKQRVKDQITAIEEAVRELVKEIPMISQLHYNR